MTGSIRASLAVFVSACLLMLALAPPPAAASGTEYRYELVADGVTYGNDMVAASPGLSVFHQQALDAADDESLDVSISRALPFSPGVAIALPSIAQSRRQSVVATAVGFVNANMPYYPCCNFGAAPVGVGQFGKPSPVTPAGIESSALMYPEMINKGILDPNLTYENKNVNSTMATLPPALAAGASSEVTAIANVTVGERLENDSAAGNVTPPPVLLSEHRYNFDANASTINNSSTVERMWRNAHIGHLMDVSYEGETSRPVWIEPLRPKEALQLTDHFKVLRYALNVTRPGEHLTKAFWDL